MKYINLNEYLPPIFLEMKDLVEINNVIGIELRRVMSFANQVNNNFTIETCDEQTLQQYEELLSIYPTPNESIEERKRTVYAILNLHLPYTIETLKENLNSLLGQNGYFLNIDYNAQKILVIIFQLEGISAKTLKLIESLLVKIPPAHMGYDAKLGIVVECESTEYYGTLTNQATIYDNYITYEPIREPNTWQDVLDRYGTWENVLNSGKTWRQIMFE